MGGINGRLTTYILATGNLKLSESLGYLMNSILQVIELLEEQSQVVVVAEDVKPIPQNIPRFVVALADVDNLLDDLKGLRGKRLLELRSPLSETLQSQLALRHWNREGLLLNDCWLGGSNLWH